MLPVNNFPSAKVTDSARQLVKDDRAQEMGANFCCRYGARLGERHGFVGNSSYIVPQRFPMFVLVPYVRTLENRRDKALRLGE